MAKVHVACNFGESRDFLIICRVPKTIASEDVIRWTSMAFEKSTHVAAFDTYSRSKSSWRLKSLREDSTEIRILVKLLWDGRRYLDLEALTFVRETPRPAPVMNAAELLHLLEAKPFPHFLSAIGVSSISPEIMKPMWDDADTSDEWFLSQDVWRTVRD
jgi:hypothetical protein